MLKTLSPNCLLLTAYFLWPVSWHGGDISIDLSATQTAVKTVVWTTREHGEHVTAMEGRSRRENMNCKQQLLGRMIKTSLAQTQFLTGQGLSGLIINSSFI